MGLPNEPVTLAPEQVAKINQDLSNLRHNVANHLSLMVATAELVRRRPEMAGRYVEGLTEQVPKRITEELRSFSQRMEDLLGITRE